MKFYFQHIETSGVNLWDGLITTNYASPSEKMTLSTKDAKNTILGGFFMKPKTVKVYDYMSGDFREIPTTKNKVVAHVKKHKTAYKVSGLTAVGFIAGPHISLAANYHAVVPVATSSVPVSGGLDTSASLIYHQLCKVGKWIIIGKGGWETINSAVKSDFESAKKNFFSYMIIYVILLALPTGLDWVDKMFSGLTAPTSGVAQ